MLGKKVCIVIITLILTLSPINSIFAVETAKSEEDIKTVIERFYDLSYESIMALEMKDMSSVLDEKSQFGRNFLIAFQRNIVENKYSLERGYTNFKRQRLPITVSVDEVAREGNKIRVKVNIEGDRSKGYPMFVCLGENNFLLKNESGNWIVESVQADDVLFTMLNERFFKEIDESAVHKAVDEEYRVETAEDSIQEKENRVYPYEDHYYSISRAIEYAEEFVFGGNGYFYVAPYDCTNFISQCVSYGFGSGYSYSSPSSYRMVSGIWYAGSGGGYPA